MFQSTHPRGVRQHKPGGELQCSKFQSTHPRGVRRVPESVYYSFLMFQSTHPRGVRHNPTSLALPKEAFQSTHPRGVRRKKFAKLCVHGLSFNPRTHEGCDKAFAEAGVKDSEFQSTHPRGVRLIPVPFDYSPAIVSIHAPTRGATTAGIIAEGSIICFNPRTHEGCDAWRKVFGLLNMQFQSTHPRGVRPGAKFSACSTCSFNPRTHEGCDWTRRVTYRYKSFCFNPRTHEGCDNASTQSVRRA